MAHPNLSPALNARLDSDNASNGFFVEDLSSGMMIDIVTGKTNYTVVVIDPVKREVAMISNRKQLEGPDIWRVMGSGWGGSMLKIGWIGVDMRMQMRRLAGGLLESSAVRSFNIREDAAKAKRIIDEAEAKRPRLMTPEEVAEYDRKLAGAVEETIIAEFESEEVRDRAREMIGRFGNNSAKMCVTGVLSQGKKYDKLEQAFKLLERDWQAHWCWQPPSIAGDPEFMALNAHRWKALYQDLGVPSPAEDGEESRLK
jgi:hypothetical protein